MRKAAHKELQKVNRINQWLLLLSEPAVDDGKGSPVVDWGNPEDTGDSRNGDTLSGGDTTCSDMLALWKTKAKP